MTFIYIILNVITCSELICNVLVIYFSIDLLRIWIYLWKFIANIVLSTNVGGCGCHFGLMYLKSGEIISLGRVSTNKDKQVIMVGFMYLEWKIFKNCFNNLFTVVFIVYIWVLFWASSIVAYYVDIRTGHQLVTPLKNSYWYTKA